MTRPLAFKAGYADWKLIKTRGVVQVILEVPLADADVAYQILGGMPEASKERWFGIAPLGIEKQDSEPARPQPDTDKPPAGAKRDWRDIGPSQQAGIRCGEPIFAAFLKEQRPDDWYEAPDATECVRLICGVTSRSELGTNQKARVIWHQLDEQFSTWKTLENA